MKFVKFAVMAGVALAAAAGFAREATLTVASGLNRPTGNPVTPFSLNLFSPIGLPWGDWDLAGFQLGLYNEVELCQGLQIGVVNLTDSCNGVQIGVINVTQRLYGLQVGVVNYIEESDLQFLPLVNWQF